MPSSRMYCACPCTALICDLVTPWVNSAHILSALCSRPQDTWSREHRADKMWTEISRLLETTFWTQSDLQSIHTSLPQYPCMTTGDACGYVVLAELAGQYQAGAGPRDGGGWSLKGCAAATQPGQSCCPDNTLFIFNNMKKLTG